MKKHVLSYAASLMRLMLSKASRTPYNHVEKKSPVKTISAEAIIYTVAFAVVYLLSSNTAFATRRVTAVAYGTQTGTATAGTGTSVTYTITLSEAGAAAPSADNLLLTWASGTPAGVTWSFTSSTESIVNGTTTTPTFTPSGVSGSTIVLTVMTTSTTPASSYGFTLKITDNNAGGGPYTSSGLALVVGVATSTISYAGSPFSYTYRTAITPLTPAITYAGGATSVSSYAIAPGLPSGLTFSTTTGIISGTPTTISSATNYTITATFNNLTTANTTINITVNKAVLTITGRTANNKTYDRTTTATVSGTAVLNGVIGSDVVTLGGTPSAVFSGSNAGTGITVIVTGYTIGGANAADYTLTQPNGLTANITAKTLTVTGASASNKIYDGTTNATIMGGTLTGVVAGDVVSVSGIGVFASANVGNGIVVSLALTGANAGNYTLTQPGITANIAIATLTITANNISKVYGNALISGPGSAAFTSTGLQNGETVGSVTMTYGIGAAVSDAVGSYTGSIIPGAATGGTFSPGNYSVTYVTGKITVTPLALTVTGLSGNNKVYDGTTAATISGTAVLSGIIGSDIVTLGGTPAYAFTTQNAGTGVTITVSGYTISGTNAGNYSLTQPTLTGNITAAPLTVTGAAASNKVYDATAAATITGTLSGIIGSDVVTLVGTGTFPNKNIGTALAVTSTCTLGGASAGNYILTQPVGLTANITAKNLTITGLTASNKVYDGTTAGTLSGSGALSGVIAGDVVNLGGPGTGTFANQNVATGIAVTASAYTISGTDAGNYTLTQLSGLTANITKASLTITATGPLKVTGFTTPVQTGATSNFIYYGTVNGETVTSVTLTPSPTTSQTAGSTYTVTPSAAAGANGFLSANYSITYFVYSGVCAGYSYTWTGNTSTTWSTNTNWSPNGIPGSSDNVSIPATVRAPNVTSSTSVNTITMTGNNTITINSAKNLTVNNGFNVNAGVPSANVVFAGASTSTVLEFSSSIFANYGIFNLSGTGLFQVDNNGSYIYNSGTFTATANATLYLQGGTNTTHALTNAGTFYAGVSGSPCNIEMDDYGSIDNSGNFYLSPTSLMYYYNDNAQFVIINNQSGGTFTLQSDATGSAAIGEVPQGRNNQFTGIFNVERYFQGGTTYASGRWVERSYRIISSCVNTGATVNGNYVYGLNYIVGPTVGQTTTANSSTNAFITGCTGGSTDVGNPSIYLYNESFTPSNASYISGNFAGITNITNSTTGGTITTNYSSTYSMPVGTGVLFFFRGAATNWSTRTLFPYIAPEDVTLTSTGNMNVGSYTFKDWYTPTSSNLAYTGTGTGTNFAVRGFNMIGNPYPCPIDWLKFYSGSNGNVRSNIGPTIWVFNPVTYQYDTYLATSSSTGTATGNASRYIASGQGFIVQATTTNPKLTISEYAKSVWNAGNGVGTGVLPAGAQMTGAGLLMSTKLQQASIPRSIRLKLEADSINHDDIFIGFDAMASASYNENEDGKYLPGLGAAEGLASLSADNVPLAINYLPLPKQVPLEIKLQVAASKTGAYIFRRTQLNAIPEVYDVWLIDKHTKDSVDMRKSAGYTFNVNLSDTASFGKARFSLIIRESQERSMHLLTFNANKANNGSQIVWTTENEQNYTNFTVERSVDGGTTFSVLGGFASTAAGKYSFLDKNPAIGTDMYRLQIADINGTISYSNVVTLFYANTNSFATNNISLYPNPAQSAITLTINEPTSSAQSINAGFSLGANNSNTVYNIKIVNSSGLMVKAEITTAKNWQTDVKNLLPGTYIMQVFNGNDNSLVGKGTFVKL